MHVPATQAAAARLLQIANARQAVLQEGRSAVDARVAGWHEQGWIERSWGRCLALGRRPQESLGFDVIAAPQLRRVREANQPLVNAARPVLEQLGRAIAGTGYFAILTNTDGIVVDALGAIDAADPRAAVITRIGTDLSERSVGTTAIGAALAEHRPVWLHRGEHFFDATGCYSCAGAPLFGPDGRCIGMLDLTGIDTVERPELKHLVAQSARSIENALVLDRRHRLLLRLDWPGRLLGDDDDGLVGVDADGWVGASNAAAREMIPALRQAAQGPLHCSELFAQAWEPLFDHPADRAPVELSLWSGLRLAVLPQAAGGDSTPPAMRLPLRDVEIAIIRKAVSDARGNVMQAARALGISRATVYRKLSKKP